MFDVSSLLSNLGPYGPLLGMAGGLVENLFSDSPEEKMKKALAQKKIEMEGKKNTNNGISKPLLKFGGITNITGNKHNKGGVDMGDAEVEDGETITNDGTFVFSDSLKLNNKSFAQLSKNIRDKYRNSKDKLDMDNLQMELEDLAIKQESLKIKELRKKMNMQGIDENGNISDKTAFDNYTGLIKPLMELGGFKNTPFKLDMFNAMDNDKIENKKKNNDIDNGFTNTELDALSVGSQLIAPMTSAIKSMRGLTADNIEFDELKPNLVTPHLISSESQLESNNLNFAKAADTLAGSAPGQGAYMANIIQLMQNKMRTDAGIIETTQNTNANIQNNAEQFNANAKTQTDNTNLNTKMYEEKINQETTDNLTNQFINALSAIGGIGAGFAKDKKMEKYDALSREQKMKILKDLYPNYTLDPNSTEDDLKLVYRILLKD